MPSYLQYLNGASVENVTTESSYFIQTKVRKLVSNGSEEWWRHLKKSLAHWEMLMEIWERRATKPWERLPRWPKCEQWSHMASGSCCVNGRPRSRSSKSWVARFNTWFGDIQAKVHANMTKDKMVSSGANNLNRSQEEETEREGHQCCKGAGFSLGICACKGFSGGRGAAQVLRQTGAQTNESQPQVMFKMWMVFKWQQTNKKEYDVTWLQYNARHQGQVSVGSSKTITILNAGFSSALGTSLKVWNVIATREQHSVSLRANSSFELQVELQTVSFQSSATLCDTQACVRWPGSWNNRMGFLKCLCKLPPFSPAGLLTCVYLGK